MTSALVLAVALAMDATAAAMVEGTAVGVTSHAVRVMRGLRLAVLFGGMQAGMAALGWLGGRALGDVIDRWDHWIAMVLLCGIGLKMLWDVRQARTDEELPPPRWGRDLALAVATSIDAAAAGVTLPQHGSPPMVLLLIGVITGGLSLLGYLVGARLGRSAGRGLTAFGGIVLIGLGVRVVVEHMREPVVGAPVPAVTSNAEAAAAPAAAPALVGRELDEPTLAAVAALAPRGMRAVVRQRDGDSVDLRLQPASSPLTVDVELSRCLACVPLSVAAWEARRDALRAWVLPPALQHDETIALQLEATTLAGLPVLLVAHQATRLVGEVPVASHALVALHHDGMRQLRVWVRDPAPARREGSAAVSAPVDDAALRALLVEVLGQLAPLL